ncbi:hypothetical protein FGG08_001439 [Glutinoglossum americanum]|uniref:F-box domain-containing protein n=1 Tax=Glutinoglossum americanum TaxID=1670608 RepID=A0A9P8IBI7_9PEZI|nr:hypothetical protein FGG08_001439 [Glutinoglossum americanum]
MASFWTEEKYQNQFFCALCGGPFARVFRTDAQIADPVRASEQHEIVDGISSLDGFSVAPERNELVTLQKVREGLSARAQLEYLTQDYYDGALEKLGRANIRCAYDGNKISCQDMRWTHVIRALIHREAREQPEGGPDQLTDDQLTYLTGHGTARQDASWADAYPSIEAELDFEDADEGDQPGIPEFDQTDFGFHMYEEPDSKDRKFRIGSIPFHDECWDLLDLAISVCGNKRGIPSMTVGEDLSTDDLWSYLRDLIPSSWTRSKSELTADSLRKKETLADPITRLSIGVMGNAGYREAQLCGDGQKWLHVEGLHWLAVSPAITPLLDEPINLPTEDVSICNTSFAPVQRGSTQDPFWDLPQEIIIEVISYLTALETGRLRIASVPVSSVQVPQKEFRRFIKEEMAYLPKLLKKTERYSSSDDPHIDWRMVYERISMEWRTSDSLRNRRRIWKIVEPMADELVETSARNLEANFELSERMSERTAVVRGYVGVRSGAEGCRQTTMLTKSFPKADSAPSRPQSPSGSISGDESSRSSASSDTRSWITAAEFVRAVVSVRIWLDPGAGNVCGFEFLLRPRLPGQGEITEMRKSFGRQTSISETYHLEPKGSPLLTGLIVCWYRGYLQGLRLVFEDNASPIDEYARGEYYSPRFGNWRGPVRRLVAPRGYRVLAGFTGFINSLGRIETFAILEEKAIGAQHYHSPLNFPLSHQEASLWAKVPPNDVEILEREGPAVGNWRTRTAECEIFEPTLQHQPPGRIKTISGFSDGEFLVGLRFQYENASEGATVRDFGTCYGESVTSFGIRANMVITGAVIGYGDKGIHSLQVIASVDGPSPTFGERYLGQQKVYVPEPLEYEKPRSACRVYLEYLKSEVVGFHWIYEPKLKRIIQLGIICKPAVPFPPSPPPSSNTSTCARPWSAEDPQENQIPFAETDNHSNYWVDGPPPSNFVCGLKRSGCHKALRVGPPTELKFAGWVSFLDPISSITIYGDMDGIRFRYFDRSRPDRYFGSTKETATKETYKFTDPRKRINRIALQGAGIRVEASGSHSKLPKLIFLTSERHKRQGVKVEVESEYLSGIKFSFTPERLTDWDPLFSWNGVTRAEQTKLIAQVQHPWRTPSYLRARPSIETYDQLSPSYRVLSDFFDHRSQEDKVDGVKGYVSASQGSQFCGLRFRRRGLWDVEPLGQASAHEISFLLHPDEVFTSIYVFLHPFGGGGALAPEKYDSIGILHEKSRNGGAQVLLKAPDISSPETDAVTGLGWVCSPKHLPKDHRFCTDVENEDYPEDPAPQRAYTLFLPEHLEKLESYVNTVPGRYGLKALKFHGNSKMGVVILGEWQERFVESTGDPTMYIQGSRSERITAINVCFYLHEHGKRIIALELETNMGRKKNVTDHTAFTDETPPEAMVENRTMRCPEGEEIVGLHYTIGLYVHDIGLIVRPKPAADATQGPT